MDIYIISLICIVVFLSILSILTHKKSISGVKKYWGNSFKLNKDLEELFDESFSEDNTSFFDTYKANRISNIITEFKSNEGDYYNDTAIFLVNLFKLITRNRVKEILYEVIEEKLNSSEYNNKFYKDFCSIVNLNNMNSKMIEDNAIEYLKQFGEEPEGEVELHPAEKHEEDDDIQEEEEYNIQYYEKMGLLEDL